MKIISALSLFLAGASAADRDLFGIGGDDRYHIHKNLQLGYGGVGPELEEVFEFQSVHREADTNVPGTDPWAGHRYAYLFRTCPHGKAEKQIAGADPDPASVGNYLGQIEDNDPTMGTWGYNGDQPDWLVTESPWTTLPLGAGDPTEYSTMWHFRVLPTIAQADVGYSGPNKVYTPLETTGGASIGGIAEFCIFFGIGDTGHSYWEIFGFREITVRAHFSYEGTFTVTQFSTQAYDPQTGQVETSQTWTTVARNCSPGPLPDTDITSTELQMVKPGMPICIEICPEPNDGQVYIHRVNTVYMEQDDPTATSAPDGVMPGTTPEDPGEIVYNVGVYPTTTITCDAGIDGDMIYGNDNIDSFDQVIVNYCCNVLFMLPARYFPTSQDDSPDRSTFNVNGDVTVLPVVRRRLGEERALQEEAGERAPINGQASWDLVSEDYEESSAMSAAAGAAAAAALGAALLL